MIRTLDECMQAYERATNSHDLDAVLALIHEQAVYLFSDESVHVGKEAIANAIRRNFDLIENETYSIVNLTWLVRTGEAAACIYDFSWSGTIRGKLVSGSGRGTTVLRRSEDGWKVIHEHLSKGRIMPQPLKSQPEIYPMPSFPTLIVADIGASARWYREALGFTEIFTMPGQDSIPSLIHLRWIKYADLLLYPDRERALAGRAKGMGVALNFAAEDVDQLAERARLHDAHILEGPVDRPWNIRELVIQDPDGYHLVFNSPIHESQQRSFDEIVEGTKKGFS